jgi:hypothetical protein
MLQYPNYNLVLASREPQKLHTRSDAPVVIENNWLSKELERTTGHFDDLKALPVRVIVPTKR